MTATRTLSAATAPGTALPVLQRTVTQAVIDRYAAASGDYNPIHVDPEYARTGPFGRTIAHGLMTLAYIAELLNSWSGGGFDDNGEVDVTFISPVYSGDELQISGEVEAHEQHNGRDCLRVRLRVTVGDRQIVAGTALQPV